MSIRGLKLEAQTLLDLLNVLKAQFEYFEGIQIQVKEDSNTLVFNAVDYNPEQPTLKINSRRENTYRLEAEEVELGHKDGQEAWVNGEADQFQFLGDGRPDFVFFSFEELKILCEISDFVIFSGARIDFGVLALTQKGQVSQFFTLKVEGDLKRLPSVMKRLTLFKNSKSFPNVLMGLPCPPHWYMYNAAIFKNHFKTLYFMLFPS